MSNPAPQALTPVAAPRLSVRALLPWLIFAALLFAAAVFFVTIDQGATAVVPGTLLHEFTHDGRHLLGFPCH